MYTIFIPHKTLNREEWDGLGMWRVWVRRGGVYRVLVGKPEGKRPLGRPRRRWVDNIRTDLHEVRCGYVDWIGLAQDRDRWRTLVNAIMNLRVPWNARNFLTSCKPVGCSWKTLHHGVSIRPCDLETQLLKGWCIFSNNSVRILWEYKGLWRLICLCE